MSAAAIVIPIKPQSLFEIVEHLEALYDSYDLVETQPLRVQIEAEIAGYVEAELVKVDGIARYLAHCKAQQGFAAEEIKRLQKRQANYEAREEQLEQRVIEIMEARGAKKLEGRTSTLSLRPCPVSVQILDEAAIPEAYKVTTVSLPAEAWSTHITEHPAILGSVTKSATVVSKTAVKDELQADRDVEGADLVIGKMWLARK
jgi:hypothetical protein